MLWLKIVVIVLAVATIVCGCYDFHLHLHNATRDEVLETTMLTLFLAVMATALGALESRLRRQ
jgi:alkylhydroperoxidase/carboxymuconolactone decarboxylase family protein YurZ